MATFKNFWQPLVSWPLAQLQFSLSSVASVALQALL